MSPVVCWCGSDDIEPIDGTVYGHCKDCGTAVDLSSQTAGSRASRDTAVSEFYEAAHWSDEGTRARHQPSLSQRARSDLSERAAFHLERILEVCAPCGSLLEIGCGHGGLTYLLSLAGFDALGLEVSRQAVAVASEQFGLSVFAGPPELLPPERKFRAIVAIDVIEHLPDPVGSVHTWMRHLEEDGVLFVQTPEYRGERSEWKMFLPGEHLFLFSRPALTRMLREAGLRAIEAASSYFPHDMWIAASHKSRLRKNRNRVRRISPELRALVDAQGWRRRIEAELSGIREDQTAKERLIHEVSQELEVTRSDQAAKESLIRQLSDESARIRQDQQLKDALISRLSTELEAVRRDQGEKSALIDTMSVDVSEVRADRQAKERSVRRLSVELEEVRADQRAKEELIARLSAELDAARRDQIEKSGLIVSLSEELIEIRTDQQAKEQLIRRISIELEEVRADQRAKEDLIGRLTGASGGAVDLANEPDGAEAARECHPAGAGWVSGKQS